MRCGVHNLLLTALCIMLLSCVTVGPISLVGKSPEQRLQETLDYLFHTPEFQNAYWGVKIQSVDRGDVLYSLREGKGFLPASNMKLYTTSAALALLGPDFRYETPIYYRGTIDAGGVLNGDVIIVGSGDPSISGRYRKEITTEQILDEWVRAFRDLGVTKITGDIVGDDDCFDDSPLAGSWENDDLSYWYATGSSGLAINDNCYSFTITPGEAVLTPATLTVDPVTSYLTIINDVLTTGSTAFPHIDWHREMTSNVIRFFGSIPMEGRPYSQFASVYNGTLYTTTLFREALERGGIEVLGRASDIDDYPDKAERFSSDRFTLVHTHVSPPLSEIIAIVNKPSQNFYADQLVKTLGYRFKSEGSFRKGAEVVVEFLRSIGVGDVDGFMMVDGSGLSRWDLVQPRYTVALLDYMIRQPYGRLFYDSLPIAGVDGTIGRRMRGTLAEGNVHAKTGFITRVRSLSGYVRTMDNELLVFSMMANNYTVPTRLANQQQDRACELLASFRRR
jgi:D-alanyl-D-alanine carboxypeptidase/D-alanyl-D-alanine-endopeptidase (penicillin-binding protein 4)